MDPKSWNRDTQTAIQFVCKQRRSTTGDISADRILALIQRYMTIYVYLCGCLTRCCSRSSLCHVRPLFIYKIESRSLFELDRWTLADI